MQKNFIYKLKVYYEDTDAGGVVYYANYLKFLERARTEALLSVGLSNIKIREEFGLIIVVKSCNIEYKKPAFLEDKLIVNSDVILMKKASLHMNQIIKRNNELISEANVHLVFINKKGKPEKISDKIVEKFKPYFNNVRSK